MTTITEKFPFLKELLYFAPSLHANLLFHANWWKHQLKWIFGLTIFFKKSPCSPETFNFRSVSVLLSVNNCSKCSYKKMGIIVVFREKKFGVLLKNMKNEVTARGRKKIIFFTVNLAVAFRFNMINKGLRISKIYDLLGQSVIYYLLWFLENSAGIFAGGCR